MKSALICKSASNNTMALVLAGGRGQRLGVLTDWRTNLQFPSVVNFE